jgi:hypothetical protein
MRMSWESLLKKEPEWLRQYKSWLNTNKHRIDPNDFQIMQTKLWNPSRLRIIQFKTIASKYPFYQDFGGPSE